MYDRIPFAVEEGARMRETDRDDRFDYDTRFTTCLEGSGNV
jgi:hypothetical protein